MLKILERKKSPAWNYFSIAEDPNFVVCQPATRRYHVVVRIPRVTCRTMNLVQYLRAKHAQLHKEFQQTVKVQNSVTLLSSPAPFWQISLWESGDCK